MHNKHINMSEKNRKTNNTATLTPTVLTEELNFYPQENLLILI